MDLEKGVLRKVSEVMSPSCTPVCVSFTVVSLAPANINIKSACYECRMSSERREELTGEDIIEPILRGLLSR